MPAGKHVLVFSCEFCNSVEHLQTAFGIFSGLLEIEQIIQLSSSKEIDRLVLLIKQGLKLIPVLQ